MSKIPDDVAAKKLLEDLDDVAAKEFLEDWDDVAPFAAKAKVHPRTVLRWMNKPGGLPYSWLGSRRKIHIPTANMWLFRRMRHPNPGRTP